MSMRILANKNGKVYKLDYNETINSLSTRLMLDKTGEPDLDLELILYWTKPSLDSTGHIKSSVHVTKK